MGLLDRLFGRRGQRGSGGDRFTRDDSYQGTGQQDQDPGSQDGQSQDPAEFDVEGAGDAGGGDGGGGGDSGGGGDGGGGGNGGGGGD
jgi:hypothetical protein